MVTQYDQSVLPSPADLQESLSPEELEILQDQYDNEEAKGYLSVQARFNLAWGLIKTQGPNSKQQISRGVALLMSLYKDDYTRRRECLYYLALGHYKLGNYDQAKRFNGMLLEKEPGNEQAQSLAKLVENDVSREGLIGLAVVGGAAALATAAVVSVVKAINKQKR